MSDGSIIEKRNGDILQATGPEFDDSPGAGNPIRVVGVQMVRLGPIQPKSVIKQLSVEVKRRV